MLMYVPDAEGTITDAWEALKVEALSSQRNSYNVGPNFVIHFAPC
jgi:hypothetical protein